jgi:hypothetical protein
VPTGAHGKNAADYFGLLGHDLQAHASNSRLSVTAIARSVFNHYVVVPMAAPPGNTATQDTALLSSMNLAGQRPAVLLLYHAAKGKHLAEVGAARVKLTLDRVEGNTVEVEDLSHFEYFPRFQQLLRRYELPAIGSAYWESPCHSIVACG